MKSDAYIIKETIKRNKAGKITQVKFRLSNGAKITAKPCYESWAQWGASEGELWVTVQRL